MMAGCIYPFHYITGETASTDPKVYLKYIKINIKINN